MTTTARPWAGTILAALVLHAAPAGAKPGKDPVWTNLSSTKGELPVPGESKQQTGAVVADMDRDGTDDILLSFRQKAPALLWYRRGDKGWTKYFVDKEFLTLEAGGAVHDIDGDGDLDIVWGQDAQGTGVWWWENPAPKWDPETPWQRHVIKNDGAKQHHDQVIADFLGTGKPQLVFWNQQAKKIMLAEIPAHPRTTEPWPYEPIFSGQAGEGVKAAALYAEGTAAADVDGDGKLDLLAGNYWFKHQGGKTFKAIKVAEIGGRIAGAKLKPGKLSQIVIAPGDGSGPLRWYECVGNPEKPRDWLGRDLVGGDIIHGHSLAVGDVNGDGKLDVVAAEMAKWVEKTVGADHPDAKAWIFYGDGLGGFRITELSTGHGFHELKLGDLDGDGDLDILNKPYTWEAPRIDVWINGGTGPRKKKPIAALRK